MAHIKHIGIKNFRIFDQDAPKIDFAPITVVTGANNSGKSSIIKALLLIKNSFEQNNKGLLHHLDLRNGKHHLGKYTNILSDEENKTLELELPCSFLGNYDFSIILEYKLKKPRKPFTPELEKFKICNTNTSDLLFSVNKLQEKVNNEVEPNTKEYYDAICYAFNTKLNVSSFISLLETLLEKLNKEKEKHDNKPKRMFWGVITDDIGFNNNLYRENPKLILEQNEKRLSYGNGNLQNSDRILFIEALKQARFILKKNIKILSNDIEISNADVDAMFQGRYDYLESILTYVMEYSFPDELSSIKKVFNNEMRYIFSSNAKVFVDNLSHLSSNRGNLSRIYSYDGDIFNNIIQEYADLVSSTDHNPFGWFINKWIKNLGLNNLEKLQVKPQYDFYLNQVFITDNNGENKKYLVDLGYGVLQFISILLHVIVHVYKNLKSQDFENVEANIQPIVIIIEEPESNLHPHWQSILAKMLIDAAKEYKIQFIIETHSEYFIRSLQNDVAEGLFPNTAIKLYYLNKKENVTEDIKQVVDIAIEEDGTIAYEAFGNGFFDERNNLELSLLNIKRKKFIIEYQELATKISNGVATIAQLNARIDAFIEKQDITTYHLKLIDDLGGVHSKMSPDSFQYLASAKYLIENLGDSSVDYSPIIAQAGRAVEKELSNFFQDFNTVVLSHPNYSVRRRNTKAWLNTMPARTIDPKFKIGDGFLKISPNKGLKFAEMQSILEALVDLNNGNGNIPNLLSLAHIYYNSKMSSQSFLDYGFTNMINSIRNKRNDACHPSRLISKQEAIDVLNDVDIFMLYWCGSKI